jgi:hypothetical protein
MWETFIRLSMDDIPLGNHIEKMRSIVFPLVSRLKDTGRINWYCLLIHDKDTGVPTTPDDKNPYLHLRIAFTKDLSDDEVKGVLSKECVLTRKCIRQYVENIAGIRKSLLKNEDIAEAWRIIGEASEWTLGMINGFKTDALVYPEVFPDQIRQFLHYYRNLLQLPVL